MMRRLTLHWHRFLEWLHQHIALHHYRRGHAHQRRSVKHGKRADLICPPEWNPRLWDRDGDPRADAEERP